MNIRYTEYGSVTVGSQYYATLEFTLINCLNKIGVDSSYNNRKKIAVVNGITNYFGTTAPNVELLFRSNKNCLHSSVYLWHFTNKQ